MERIPHRHAGACVSRPLALVYCEYHGSKVDALRRESHFKTTAGKKAIKLMLREALAKGAKASEMRPPELRVSAERVVSGVACGLDVLL